MQKQDVNAKFTIFYIKPILNVAAEQFNIKI